MSKKPVRVSIDAELAAEAKNVGVNLSELLEKALREELAKLQRWAEWREENRAAIEESNRQPEKHGLPLANHRAW